MLNTRPLFCLSWFRHRFIAWLFLPIFCCSFFPQISNAQQVQTPVTEINITDIQSLLQQLGYDPGPLDGIMGKKTAAAITAFQTAINIPVNGQATTELLALLQRELAKTTGPTATLTALNGIALVNGQTAEQGVVLIVEDVLETQVETTVELTFSDQSQVELDGATRLGIRELSQTETGARITSLNLLAGRIRANISPEHQQAGSAFTVETPNARIEATFSQPDIEVSYNQEKAETIGIAHTVKLMAKNLATNEEVLVPVGSTIIITSEATKVLVGIITTSDAMKPEPTPEPEPVPELIATPELAPTPEPVSKAAEATTGIGTGKMIAIGAGALAAVGGIIAIAGGSSSGSNGGSESSDGSDNSLPVASIANARCESYASSQILAEFTIRLSRSISQEAYVSVWQTSHDSIAVYDLFPADSPAQGHVDIPAGQTTVTQGIMFGVNRCITDTTSCLPPGLVTLRLEIRFASRNVTIAAPPDNMAECTFNYQ